MDLADKGSEAIGKAYDRGLITQKTALREMRQLSSLTGIFSNITDEDIESADDAVSPPGGMVPDMTGFTTDGANEFQESDHPRAPDGKFGSGGAKNSGEEAGKSSKIYSRIEGELRGKGLLNSSEQVMSPKPINISGASDHAKDALKKRHITMEDAQHYVDSAMVMIQQSKDKFNFVAEDGCSYVLESGRLVSVISKADYDPLMRQKIEVIESWLKKK